MNSSPVISSHHIAQPAVHEMNEQEYRRQRDLVERSVNRDERPADVYPWRIDSDLTRRETSA